MTDLTRCPWCYTMVAEPCSTVVECKTCSEPYTLTDEQAAQYQEIVAVRGQLREKPLPLEED